MKQRGRAAWITGGSILMAALAAIALGATVLVAERALAAASDVIVRGEGDLLLGALAMDLGERRSPPDRAALEAQLEAHGSEGLRYLAVLEGPRLVAEAGTSEMRDAPLRPGQMASAGRRVRIAGPLFPQRRPRMDRTPDRPPERPPHPALLVVELEPPIVEKLHADLRRIAVVAACAGAVLIAFAIAWSKSARRLAAIEERAAREQRLVALGRMSSVMAHELRNPLASLKGHAQLLAEDLEDDKRRAKADRVVGEAERLERLITSLLEFVRDAPIERASIAPDDLVARALEDLDGARVDVDTHEAPRSLSIDGPRVARALHNVIENALLAGPEGRVDLRVARDGADVVVTVRDRGPGIAVGSEERIFEPFVTTRVRGTGLGLAVARRIAEQHRGTLLGRNHPEGGAVFELRLPSAAEGA